MGRVSRHFLDDPIVILGLNYFVLRFPFIRPSLYWSSLSVGRLIGPQQQNIHECQELCVCKHMFMLSNYHLM